MNKKLQAECEMYAIMVNNRIVATQ